MLKQTLTAAITTAALAAFPAGAIAQDAEEGSAGPKDRRDGAHLQSADDIKIVNNDGDVIGEIEEILIDENGIPAGYMIEVGGFIDIGDKEVAVPLDALEWNGAHYVSTMTENQLMNLAPFDE